jgi:hypothetical protein
MDPRLLRALVAWIKARETRLGDRVRPSVEQPGSVGPYLTYTHIATNRIGNMEGRTGQTSTRLQLDVWDQDAARGASVASRIAGTGTESNPALRGLDHYTGEWPDPDVSNAPVIVQFAERVDAFNDEASPTLGTETAWYRFSADYEITYEEIT